MFKIAIFSDVHANLPALHAVLADIEQQKVAQLYCLGDLVDFAPWNNEIIDAIRDRKIPTIMGNHDERIAFDIPVVSLKKHTHEESAARIEAIEYTRRTITPLNKAFLKSLPRQISLTFERGGQEFKLLLVHGSAREIDEYVYEDHDEQDLIKMLEAEKAEVMVVGHTHISYIRHLDHHSGKRTVINCGSVSRSKEGNQLATYLIVSFTDVSVDYELKKVPYDVDKVRSAIKDSPIPDFYAKSLGS